MASVYDRPVDLGAVDEQKHQGSGEKEKRLLQERGHGLDGEHLVAGSEDLSGEFDDNVGQASFR